MNLTPQIIDLASLLGVAPAGPNSGMLPEKAIGSSPESDFLQVYGDLLLEGIGMSSKQADDPNSAQADQSLAGLIGMTPNFSMTTFMPNTMEVTDNNQVEALGMASDKEFSLLAESTILDDSAKIVAQNEGLDLLEVGFDIHSINELKGKLAASLKSFALNDKVTLLTGLNENLMGNFDDGQIPQMMSALDNTNAPIVFSMPQSNDNRLTSIILESNLPQMFVKQAPLQFASAALLNIKEAKVFGQDDITVKSDSISSMPEMTLKELVSSNKWGVSSAGIALDSGHIAGNENSQSLTLPMSGKSESETKLGTEKDIVHADMAQTIIGDESLGTSIDQPEELHKAVMSVESYNNGIISDKNSTMGIHHVVKQAESSVSTPESEPVRFVLPRDIEQNNVRTGQTVIIKMEPEHLGNVRLTLSNHHDTVTGRLVVDNLAAQTAVENNLDSLIEQLSKQGIKLDHFDVSLSGGSVGHRFAQDNTSGNYENGNHQQGNLERNNNNNEGLYSSEVIPHSEMYINSNGVNWIA
jgi:flagellar hook-length control protein FliK